MTLDPPFIDVSFCVASEAEWRERLSAEHGPGRVRLDETWFEAPEILGVAEGELLVQRGRVLSFRTTGADYSAPTEADMSGGFATGTKLREGLLSGMARYDASYGAIVFLEWLGEPAELLAGTRTSGFRDFALAEAHFSGDVLKRVEAMYPDAYTARTGGVLYVSTTQWFNPGRRAIDPDEARRRSRRVSQMVGYSVGV